MNGELTAFDRIPPQNLEAEQSVLGAILLDNTAMAKAMEIIVDEDFYRTAHRKVYQGMLALSDRGEVIDQITLTECLKSRSELEAVGGAAYLAELVQVVASAANVRYHCKIVRERALLRGLIHTSVAGRLSPLRYFAFPFRAAQRRLPKSHRH